MSTDEIYKDLTKDFKKTLGKFRVMGILERSLEEKGDGFSFATQRIGVDYYGIPRVREEIFKLNKPKEFIISIFLDALISSALHSSNLSKHRSIIVERPVFILNGYNIINTPEADISLKYPQCLLGLNQDWTEADLGTLREFTERYFKLLQEYFEITPDMPSFKNWLIELMNNEDLRETKIKLEGCAISESVVAAYFDGLKSLKRDE